MLSTTNPKYILALYMPIIISKWQSMSDGGSMVESLSFMHIKQFIEENYGIKISDKAIKDYQRDLVLASNEVNSRIMNMDW